MRRGLWLAAFAASLMAGSTVQGADADATSARPVVLEDQFENTQDIGQYRGDVVVLVYGDRKATDACRELGEHLHVAFHPSARGMAPAEAQRAPVRPLDGLPAEARTPEVRVVPVACIGSVPSPIRGIIRRQIRKGSPEVPVWLDFENTMKTRWGLESGQPNLVVFDGSGQPRLRHAGMLDREGYEQLTRQIELLRREAAGLR